MKRFSLRFVDGTGREVERIVFANSKKEVLTRAGEKGIDLLSVDEKRTVSDCLTKSRCLSPENLSFFFDQSARLTEAGIPFVEAWKLLAHDIKKREQQASLRACIAKMEGGERAAAAMEESGLFPRLACALVRAGEHSGRLDEMLRLSGDYYETARELVSDLQILRTHSIGNQAAAKEVKKIYVRSGEYVLTNSIFSIEKRKVFPETVRSRSNGNGIVSFDAAGRPEGKTMHIVIESQDKAYKRDIIIAAQTGRIRME